MGLCFYRYGYGCVRNCIVNLESLEEMVEVDMSDKSVLIFTAILVAFLLGFIVLLTASVEATTYYMKTDGSNSANGLTLGTAWLTLQYSVDQLSAGDTLRVNIGTYTGTETNLDVEMDSSGTVGNPIVIRGYQGIPLFDGEGNDYAGSGSAFQLDSVEYVYVDSMKWKCIGDTSDQNEAGGIRIDEGSRYCKIRWCEVCTVHAGDDNTGGYELAWGIMIHEAMDNEVMGCQVSNVYSWNNGGVSWSGTAHSGGIKTTSTSSGGAKQVSRQHIHGNTVFDCGAGISLKTSQCDSTLIDSNIIHDTDRAGIHTDGDYNCIKYNVIYNVNDAGILVSALYDDVVACTVYNNTISGTGDSLGIGIFALYSTGGGPPSLRDSSWVFNNIVCVHNDDYGGYTDGDSFYCGDAMSVRADYRKFPGLGWDNYDPAFFYSDYNCFYDTADTDTHNIIWDSTHAMSLPEWVSYATSTVGFVTGKDSNSVFADPVFEDEANNDYNLTAGSPAALRTGGRGGSYPSYMGAYEYSEAAATVKKFGKGQYGTIKSP